MDQNANQSASALTGIPDGGVSVVFWKKHYGTLYEDPGTDDLVIMDDLGGWEFVDGVEGKSNQRLQA